jgi:glutamate synthase (NADH)
MGRSVGNSTEQIIEEEQTSVYEYQNTPENRSWAGALPLKQGLYDPELEKDACGVGFAA